MKKVIVIDDDVFIRTVLIEVLSAKYEVLHAEDGAAGLALVVKEAPDLVVLDFAMPKMHGFEVCRKIREVPALKGTKILMSSSKSYIQDISNAKAAGVDDYMVKPYKMDDLLAKVAQLLGE